MLIPLFRWRRSATGITATTTIIITAVIIITGGIMAMAATSTITIIGGTITTIITAVITTIKPISDYETCPPHGGHFFAGGLSSQKAIEAHRDAGVDSPFTMRHG